MRWWCVPTILLLLGCADVPAVPPPMVLMDYEGPGFFDAPFPDEHHRGPDGLVDVSAFPNPTRADFVTKLVQVAGQSSAFATTATLFFRATAELDLAVEYGGSTVGDAPAFLMNLERTSAAFGERHPVEVRFRADGGPFGAPNLISLLPLQGRPLEPEALYAAVITDAVRTVDGKALTTPPALASMRAGERPPGLGEAAFAAHLDALEALADAGVSPARVAGLAVFRTADPTAGLRRARDQALALEAPTIDGLGLVETFDGYCVYEGTTVMPDYQRGVLPYDEGGGWDLERPPGAGDARVVLTIIRSAEPGAPLPAVLFSRTGGGGDRPLVDRGVRDASGEVLEPGSGPAREFAAVGWAGVSVDGPHGGPRNPTGMDEQFLIFNVQNPIAMRDNIRQSSLELTVAARMLAGLSLDASDCPGVGGLVVLDPRALMGHSMGATISPLAFALEPRFEALVLSGAGGSWIENVVHKESPVPVRPFAELLLNVSGRHRLHEHDPVLALLQWTGESADPPVYAMQTPRGDRHVLMLQGVVDTYILPPMANATSLSLELDLAGDPLDGADDRLSAYAPLAERLAFSGAGTIPLPARGNRGSATAVVVQHAQDAVEDGHEVVFQTDPPKAQYRCFLETLLGGVPLVPAAAGPCP